MNQAAYHCCQAMYLALCGTVCAERTRFLHTQPVPSSIPLSKYQVENYHKDRWTGHGSSSHLQNSSVSSTRVGSCTSIFCLEVSELSDNCHPISFLANFCLFVPLPALLFKYCSTSVLCRQGSYPGSASHPSSASLLPHKLSPGHSSSCPWHQLHSEFIFLRLCQSR